jgi:hypothetical protein
MWDAFWVNLVTAQAEVAAETAPKGILDILMEASGVVLGVMMVLAVMSAGAYGFTMASNYNTRPLPAEILVEGSKATVVRERQTLDDVLKGEHIA